jgi:hypothetical protein
MRLPLTFALLLLATGCAASPYRVCTDGGRTEWTLLSVLPEGHESIATQVSANRAFPNRTDKPEWFWFSDNSAQVMVCINRRSRPNTCQSERFVFSRHAGGWLLQPVLGARVCS